MVGRYNVASISFRLVLVFVGIFGGKYYLDNKNQADDWAHSVAVATVAAEEATWQQQIQVVGTLRAEQGVNVTTQLPGQITAIYFQSGAKVEKGEPLLQLDNSNQLAILEANQARLEQAEIDLKRAQKLRKQGAISEDQLQTAEVDLKVAAAVVKDNQATLDKLRIVAPFTGQLGIREVNLGQYLSIGESIVNMQQLDTLLLDFSLPQEQRSVLRLGQTVNFKLSASQQDNVKGKLTAIAAQIDPTTRNIRAQATLDNSKGLLQAGGFGQVLIESQEQLQGIVVPEAAVVYSTFGDSVYVVAEGDYGKTAQAKLVQVLAHRQGQVLLSSQQLEAEEEVITAGQNKLYPGVAITIDNSVQP